MTGASGGLGAGLAERLAGRGLRVKALVRSPSIAGLPGVMETVPGDLLDPGSYRGRLGDADVIVHLAALTHSARAREYFNVNVEGTRRLVEAALDEGFSGRFLLVSTRAVGAECGAYGESKLMAEEVVMSSGLSWTIARPSEVYGCSRGEAVSSLVSLARRSLVVPVPGKGRDRLSPVFVEDVLGALSSMTSLASARGKVYTLAGPEEMDYRELVHRVFRHYGKRGVTVGVPYFVFTMAAKAFRNMKKPPLVEDQVWRLRCGKCSDIGGAAEDLGYAPITLENGLAFLDGKAPLRPFGVDDVRE